MNGISVLGIVFSYCIFGLFFIYKSKKTNAELLFYAGLVAICAGLGWIAPCIDFITILLTGNNMDIVFTLYFHVIGTMLIPLTQIFLIYIAVKLIIPEKKWYILLIYLALGIAFEIALLLDTKGSLTLIYPDSPAEDLIDMQFAFGSPLFIIYIIFLPIIIFCGIGMLIKGIRSKGVIRKKLLLISMGIIFTLTIAITDAITAGIIIIFVRFGMVSCLMFFYLGLREEPEKIKKSPERKDIRIEKSLFRITQRPTQITEEDVTFHKERNICLVCKGKAVKFTYICEKCDALYCVNCAKALTDLENQCWVCNEPIDESKPVKLLKEEEKTDFKISDKK